VHSAHQPDLVQKSIAKHVPTLCETLYASDKFVLGLGAHVHGW